MTLDQLRVFVAVAEREHLTRAAAALNLTPSTVSAAVQALEGRYGARLFDRVGRRIALTEAGRLFLVEARVTLAAARAAERALLELGGLARGTLAIAASQTIASYWLPPPLVAFRAAHPGIIVALAEANTARVVAAVLEGRADIGFIEGAIDEPALSVATVADDRLVVVAAPEHPLAGRAAVTAADLAAARWVMREPGSGTRALLEGALRAEGVAVAAAAIVLELPTNEAVCAAARAGACLTAVSDLVARPHIEAGRLVAIDHPLPTRAFALLRHKERYKSKASLAFEAMLGGG